MASTIALPFSLWALNSKGYEQLVRDVASLPVTPSGWADDALGMAQVKVEGPSALVIAEGLLEAATRIGAQTLFGERGLETWERFTTRLQVLANDLQLAPSLIGAAHKSDPVAHISDLDLFVEPYVLGVLIAELVTHKLVSAGTAREVDTASTLSLRHVGVEQEQVIGMLQHVLGNPRDRVLSWHPVATWLNDFGALNSVLVAHGEQTRWRAVAEAVWGRPVLASSSRERFEDLVSEAAILGCGEGVSPFNQLDDATFSVDETALALLTELSPPSAELQAKILAGSKHRGG